MLDFNVSDGPRGEQGWRYWSFDSAHRNDDQYYAVAALEESVTISDTVHWLTLISMAKPLRSLLILALETCLLDRTNAAQPTQTADATVARFIRLRYGQSQPSLFKRLIIFCKTKPPSSRMRPLALLSELQASMGTSPSCPWILEVPRFQTWLPRLNYLLA